MRGKNSQSQRRGFSLTELLVVMLIFGILTTIAVRSLITSLPQRQLAATGDRFANDISYCMAKAQSSGNTVYMGFTDDYSRWLDASQVHCFQDPTTSTLTSGNARPDPTAVPAKNGQAFINPANPGVSRVAKQYYIVEERPRWKYILDPNHPALTRPAHPDYGKLDTDPNWQPQESDIRGQLKFTYGDWIRAHNNWAASPGTYAYPLEPIFPYNATETVNNSGYIPDLVPTDTGDPFDSFNRQVAPLALYPQDMLSAGGSYIDRHYSNSFSADWSTGANSDQTFKTFCVADRAEILSYDANNNGVYDKFVDHISMEQQVKDYVLLKRVELPEHAYFFNPWVNDFIVGWENTPSGVNYDVRNMQFLQYLIAFHPSGEVTLAEWTYDPIPFPDGSYSNEQVHGRINEIDTLPGIRQVWILNDECIDFTNASPLFLGWDHGSRFNLADNTKSDLSANGRVITLWPLNGKYYVDEYSPNDGARSILVGTPEWSRLDLNYVLPSGPNTMSSPLVAREAGYSQNFLMDPGG